MESPTREQAASAVGNTFVWHEVRAPNDHELINFYTGALGFGVHETEMAGYGVYRMLTRDGIPVAGVVSTNMPGLEGAPPHWATYISVDDIDARLAKCQSMGANVVVPTLEVPTVGRMACITDPQGAHVWLFQPSIT